MSTPQSNYRSPDDIPNEELISGYLDGELTAAEQATVERLLQEDESFRLLFEDLKSLRGKLQSLPQLEPSANLANTILARTELELRGSAGQDAYHLQPKSATVAGAVAKVNGLNDLRRLLIAAVSLSAAVLLAFLLLKRPGDEGGPGVAQNPNPEKSVRPAPNDGNEEISAKANKKPMNAKSEKELGGNSFAADPLETPSGDKMGGRSYAQRQPPLPGGGPGAESPRGGLGGGGFAPEDPAARVARTTTHEMTNAFEPRPVDVVSLDRQVFVVHLDKAQFVKKLAEHEMKFTEQTQASKGSLTSQIRVETSMAQLRKLLSDEETRPALNLFAYGDAERLASKGLQSKYRDIEDDNATGKKPGTMPQVAKGAAPQADLSPLAPTSPAKKAQSKARRAVVPGSKGLAGRAVPKKPAAEKTKLAEKKSLPRVEKSKLANNAKQLGADRRTRRAADKLQAPGGKLGKADPRKTDPRKAKNKSGVPRPSALAGKRRAVPPLAKTPVRAKDDKAKVGADKAGIKQGIVETDGVEDSENAARNQARKLVQEIQKALAKSKAHELADGKTEAARSRLESQSFGGGGAGGGSFGLQNRPVEFSSQLPRFSKRGETLYMEAEKRDGRGLSAADSSELMELAQRLQGEGKGGASPKATVPQQPNDRVVVLFVLRDPNGALSSLKAPTDSARASAKGKPSKANADAEAAKKPRK